MLALRVTIHLIRIATDGLGPILSSVTRIAATYIVSWAIMADTSPPVAPPHHVEEQAAADDALSLTSTVPDEEQESSVENILCMQTHLGRPYYLVKWEGYPIEHATWEPIESFSDAQATIDMWDRTRRAIEAGGEQSADLVRLQQRAIDAINVRQARRTSRREARARLQAQKQGAEGAEGLGQVHGQEQPSDGTTMPLPATAAATAAGDETRLLSQVQPPLDPNPLAVNQYVASYHSNDSGDDGASSTPSSMRSDSPPDDRPPLSPISAAIAALEDGRFANPHQAAKALGLDYNALRTRYRAKHPDTARQRNPGRRRLTPAEEEVVVRSLTRAHAQGRTLSYIDITGTATSLLLKREPDAETFTGSWARLFLERHPQLKPIVGGFNSPKRKLDTLHTPSPARQTARAVTRTPVRTPPSTRRQSLRLSGGGSGSADGEPDSAAASSSPLQPGPSTVRFKVHSYSNEVRFALVPRNATVHEFESRIQAKLGLAGKPRLAMRDGEDLVTIGDQEDLNIVMSQAKQGLGPEVRSTALLYRGASTLAHALM
ncbi:hypothetical protein KEM52_005738 [Ascosphaera acerosa]|nr:hypothetical protein KEM52_005738 [Ascosphaera acerosa]